MACIRGVKVKPLSCEEVNKRTIEFILKVEDAHKSAANSKLMFGDKI